MRTMVALTAASMIGCEILVVTLSPGNEIVFVIGSDRVGAFLAKRDRRPDCLAQ